MNEMTFFEELAARCQLGRPLCPPSPVSGGYLHKMYRLDTSGGRYAVKLLNPSIMRRPDAQGNFARAERLERVLQKHDLPIVPALEIDGRKMQCIGGQYAYVFPWLDAKALSYEEIRPDHCAVMGSILAKTHSLEQKCARFSQPPFQSDWQQYAAQAETRCPELAAALHHHMSLLYTAQQEYNRAMQRMPPRLCISHADMDCKNVLWSEGNPHLIDLECLDYGCPPWDMFILALSWAGGAVCALNTGRLIAFVSAYRASGGEIGVCWEDLYGSGYAWLDWLKYNTRRALGMEGGDSQEQALGKSQALDTLLRIVHHRDMRETVLEKLHSLTP